MRTDVGGYADGGGLIGGDLLRGLISFYLVSLCEAFHHKISFNVPNASAALSGGIILKERSRRRCTSYCICKLVYLL